MILAATPRVAGAEENLSGEWEYTFLGYRLEAHVEHRGESIQGVAYLHSPMGTKDTYHFTGTFHQGEVVASHHSGHTFRGQLISADEVMGVLVTARGERWTLTARRR